MTIESARQEILSRMQRPQRHRLLQGYPPLPLMQPAIKSDPEEELVRQADGGIVNVVRRKKSSKDVSPPFIEIDPARPLIIGIIPHTQCIPRTPACGFCTFPHDVADKRQRFGLRATVMDDIDKVVSAHSDKLAGRRVDAIYFGGGTANLSSAPEIRAFFAVLAEHFKVAQAEVTLEGIPSLFASWFYAHLRSLSELPARHKRISMGIQTFDPGQIERMGRQSFGNEKTLKGIVRRGHELGLTVSGDFLFDLPGQTFDQMRADVIRAIDCGLDQICLYHLVLYAGLGTPWSKNPELVGAMKSPEAISDDWLKLRELLLEHGFVQATLTNFEGQGLHKTDRRFIYEEASFNPDVYDALGFGPLSISMLFDYRNGRGTKLMRRKAVAHKPWSGDDLYFGYEKEDLKLLWITRCLAGLSFDRARYQARFGTDVADDFPVALSAATESGLVKVDDKTLSLTPRGMFYSDSVVGTFAAERSAQLRGTAAGINTSRVLEEPILLRSELYGGMG